MSKPKVTMEELRQYYSKDVTCNFLEANLSPQAKIRKEEIELLYGILRIKYYKGGQVAPSDPIKCYVYKVCDPLLRLGVFMFKLVILLLFPALSQAEISCDKNPIYCQIVKNAPNINKEYARELSNVIYKETRKENINSTIFTAILMQESSYKLSAMNCSIGVEALKLEKESQHLLLFEKKVCTDFGIGQIHFITAKRYGVDINRLLTDLTYSIKMSIIVLKDFKKRYYKKESDWWTRYNSSNTYKRELYRKKVLRWL